MTYINYVIHKSIEIGFDSLLDVGCGEGRFLFEIKNQVEEKRLVGVDYSQRATEFAKIFSPEVEWLCGDITDSNLLDMKFDLITLIETLEHIPFDEIDDFLRGINRYLKTTGKFIITVPSINVPLPNKSHYQHFDLESLRAIITEYF